MKTQRDTWEMCGYKHEQVATKTMENAQQEDPQRGSEVDDLDTRSKTKSKKSFTRCLKI
jgi:hypothetical protein